MWINSLELCVEMTVPLNKMHVFQFYMFFISLATLVQMLRTNSLYLNQVTVKLRF